MLSMFSLASQDSSFRCFCFIKMHWEKAGFRFWRMMCSDQELKQKFVWTLTVFCKDDTLPGLTLPCGAPLFRLKCLKTLLQLLCNLNSTSPPHIHDLQKSKCLWNKDRWLSAATVFFCLLCLNWIFLESIADLFEVHPLSLTYWYFSECMVY